MSTNECCVIPSSRYGLKANKASTDQLRDFLNRVLALNQIRLVIFVGASSFKYMFGRGKNPSSSIFGNIIHMPESPNAPLYVFPDLDGLYYTVTGNRYQDSRQLDWQEKTQLRFSSLIKKLKPTIEELNHA